MKIQILNRAVADVLWRDRLQAAGFVVLCLPPEPRKPARWVVQLGSASSVTFDQPRLGIGKPVELDVSQIAIGRALVIAGIAAMLDARTPGAVTTVRVAPVVAKKKGQQ